MTERKQVNTSDENTFKPVDESLMEELLILYPRDRWIIKNCQYKNQKLRAELIPKEITYSNATPDYYTAEQLLIATSQMGYLFFGLLIIDKTYKKIEPDFYSKYIEKIKRLECYYIDLHFRFTKKLLKKKMQVMNLTLTNVRRSNDRMIGMFKVEVEGAFKSKATLIYE